jgi:hypothetical protein
MSAGPEWRQARERAGREAAGPDGPGIGAGRRFGPGPGAGPGSGRAGQVNAAGRQPAGGTPVDGTPVDGTPIGTRAVGTRAVGTRAVGDGPGRDRLVGSRSAGRGLAGGGSAGVRLADDTLVDRDVGGAPRTGTAGDPAGAPGSDDDRDADQNDERAFLRWRLVLSAVGLAVAAVALVTARVFVYPTRDAPTRVDAIVMFAGSAGRLEQATALARAGYAPVLAVSQPTPNDPCPPTPAPGVEVVCFGPRPLTTRGEARWTARAAAERGWRSIIVITSTPQDSRARLRLARCYPGEVRVVPVSPATRSTWTYMVAYEWAATAKALLWQRGC